MQHNQSHPVLLGIGLTLTLIIAQPGCRKNASGLYPALQPNQELSQMGNGLGIKSYGETNNVSVYPVAIRKHHIDLLVIAENHHGEPFYFGRGDIAAFDPRSKPLTMPDLPQVITELGIEKQRTADILVDTAEMRYRTINDPVNPRQRTMGPEIGLLEPTRGTNPFRTFGQNIVEERRRIEIKKLREDLELLDHRYERIVQRMRENWLQSAEVLPGDYTQGVVRVSLKELRAGQDALHLKVFTGSDEHHIELSLNKADPNNPNTPALASM